MEGSYPLCRCAALVVVSEDHDGQPEALQHGVRVDASGTGRVAYPSSSSAKSRHLSPGSASSDQLNPSGARPVGRLSTAVGVIRPPAVVPPTCPSVLIKARLSSGPSGAACMHAGALDDQRPAGSRLPASMAAYRSDVLRPGCARSALQRDVPPGTARPRRAPARPPSSCPASAPAAAQLQFRRGIGGRRQGRRPIAV